MLEVVKFVADTLPPLPTPTAGTSFLFYGIALVGAGLGAWISKLYEKGRTDLTNVDNTVQPFIVSAVSFLIIKLAVLVGVTPPTDILNLDPTYITALISGVLGWGATKLGAKTT